jgi:hypothetical protein
MNARQKNSRNSASKQTAAPMSGSRRVVGAPASAESSALHAAREAAARYAEDSAFASAFESALHEIYVEHLDTLKRIEKRLGAPHSDPTEAAHAQLVSTHAPRTQASSAALVTSERVQDLIRVSSARGLTRGDIAARLGIDNRDVRLTRVLRALKNDRLVRQSGVRRSARYHATPGETRGSAREQSCSDPTC